MKKIEVCTRCGSARVYADAFANLNDENDIQVYDDTHCFNCEGECNTKTVEVPNDFDLFEDFYEEESNAIS